MSLRSITTIVSGCKPFLGLLYFSLHLIPCCIAQSCHTFCGEVAFASSRVRVRVRVTVGKLPLPVVASMIICSPFVASVAIRLINGIMDPESLRAKSSDSRNANSASAT